MTLITNLKDALRLRTILLVLAAVAAALSFGDISAQAQATRTWVSGVGDDANPCSRTAPCKTFAGAISKTAASGEINCLDSGGFGALTITKSIAIICEGVEAGVLVSGTNGFNVNVAATDVVYLRGLDFEGLGASPSGINFTAAGELHVEKCQIRGFNTGIAVSTSGGSNLYVADTVIADNNRAASGNNGGIVINSTRGANVNLERVRLTNNYRGLAAAPTGGVANVAITDSIASNNADAGFGAFSAGGP